MLETVAVLSVLDAIGGSVVKIGTLEFGSNIRNSPLQTVLCVRYNIIYIKIQYHVIEYNI